VGVGVGSATLPLLGFSMTIVEDDLSCLAGRPAESDDLGRLQNLAWCPSYGISDTLPHLDRPR
jgi:hypothetical protein